MSIAVRSASSARRSDRGVAFDRRSSWSLSPAAASAAGAATSRPADSRHVQHCSRGTIEDDLGIRSITERSSRASTVSIGSQVGLPQAARAADSDVRRHPEQHLQRRADLPALFVVGSQHVGAPAVDQALPRVARWSRTGPGSAHQPRSVRLSGRPNASARSKNSSSSVTAASSSRSSSGNGADLREPHALGAERHEQLVEHRSPARRTPSRPTRRARRWLPRPGPCASRATRPERPPPSSPRSRRQGAAPHRSETVSPNPDRHSSSVSSGRKARSAPVSASGLGPARNRSAPAGRLRAKDHEVLRRTRAGWRSVLSARPRCASRDGRRRSRTRTPRPQARRSSRRRRLPDRPRRTPSRRPRRRSRRG